MPKSATISLVSALLGVTIFLGIQWSVGIFPTKQQLIAVGVDCFNGAAILSLFYIFYANEKATAARFGAVVRSNISTIIVALMISFIGSLFDIASHFDAPVGLSDAEVTG